MMKKIKQFHEFAKDTDCCEEARTTISMLVILALICLIAVWIITKIPWIFYGLIVIVTVFLIGVFLVDLYREFKSWKLYHRESVFFEE